MTWTICTRSVLWSLDMRAPGGFAGSDGLESSKSFNSVGPSAVHVSSLLLDEGSLGRGYGRGVACPSDCIRRSYNAPATMLCIVLPHRGYNQAEYRPVYMLGGVCM